MFEVDGRRVRDLNGNGRLDPYEDPRRPRRGAGRRPPRPDDARREGGPDVPPADRGRRLKESCSKARRRSAAKGRHRLVVDRHLNHFNIYETPDARRLAEWHNRLQRLAETTRLGIPVTISSDPRHSFDENAVVELVDRLVLAVARADRARRDARRRAGSRLRRDRPPGIPRRRHPRRTPPDGGRRHRATLGADRRHVRRGLRARRPPDRGVRSRLPGRRARTDQRRLHDEALPRRRPAGRRRGSRISRTARIRSIPASASRTTCGRSSPPSPPEPRRSCPTTAARSARSSSRSASASTGR